MENLVSIDLFPEFQVPKVSSRGDKSLEYSIHDELVNARIISGIFA
jgi:hypothetical protein